MKTLAIIFVLLAMVALAFNQTSYTVCYLIGKAKRWIKWKIKINFQRGGKDNGK